ncbi:MAG: 2OG-Fe dioxygenase family protein [Lysobacterales bacterium]
MTASFPPPSIPAAELPAQMRAQGDAVLAASGLAELTGCEPAALDALKPSWDALPPDEYLKDGGRYRRRRHSCFVFENDVLLQAPHRAHWQSLDYNALHGGMHRWFEPIEPAVVAAPAWPRLLSGLARACSGLRPASRWCIEAHQFRIDTSDGLARPTPEARTATAWISSP